MYRNVCILLIILFASLTNLFPKDAKPILLKSASEYDYPPFCIVNEDSTAGGFSVELLQAACEVMDIKIDFKVGEWSVIKQELADGKLDVLPLVGRTPEREEFYDFTFPYMTYHGAVFARTGETRFKTRNDLKKARLMVMKGDNAEEYVRRVKLADSVCTTFSFEDAFKYLSEGKCDIVITQKVMGLNLVKQSGIVNVEPLAIEIIDFQQNFCFAVPKGRTELLAHINEGLSIIIADGTFGRLRQKWFEPVSEIGKTKLVVGIEAHYPPFSDLDDKGNPAGYNVDLTVAVAKQLGILVEIKSGSWAEMKEALKSGRIDALAGMHFTDSQDKSFRFSPPHLVTDHVIIVRNGSEGIKDVSDLKGKTILVMNGCVMHEFLLKQGFDKEIHTLKSQEEVLKILSEGKYDCALVSHTLAHYYIEKNKLKNLKVIEKSYVSQEYCFAVKKGNENLLRNISDAITALNESGEYRKIYSKWFGAYHEESIDYKRIVKYASAVFIGLIILLSGFIIWNKTLKKQVGIKTTELTAEIERRKESEDMLRQNEMLLKDNEEKYRQIFESASEGILMAKPDGTILHANPEACKIFHRSEDEIISLGRDRLFDVNDPRLAESLDIRKKTGSFKGEVNAFRKDGSTVHLFLTSNIYTDSKDELRAITIFSDISERKMAEAKLEENLKELEKSKKATLNLLKDVKDENAQRKKAEENLRKLNEELENKVKERTKQLDDQNHELITAQESLVMLLSDVNESRRELERVNGLLISANKELEAFSYSVSHDLRSPLRAITGFADILKNDYCKDLDAEGMRFIDRINENSERMKVLIDDLLEYSRVGRAAIHPVKLDLKNEAERIFSDLISAEKNRKFNFTVSDNIPAIMADRTLFSQMLQNLLGNAVKFTAKKDIAEVKINYEKKDNFHIISIEDNGAGFDEKYKSKLFEVFQRLHNSEDFQGTGVGLSIVQKVAVKHGWQIDGEGKVGVGAKFIIKIPVNEG